MQTLRERQAVHFLHIGKTGGTAIKYALKPFLINDRFVIHLHPHTFTLRNVPEGERALFFLRDPVTRFVSAFYSRQRQGQPRIFMPWTPDEKVAFSHFDTPNKLAIALSAEDENERAKAVAAMKSIGHIRMHYWDWFDSEQYLMSRVADIMFIGFQESLVEDFQRLKAALGIPEAAALPADDVQSHRNPSHLDKSLQEQAVENLKQWYQQDYQLIAVCQGLVDQMRLNPERKTSP